MLRNKLAACSLSLILGSLIVLICLKVQASNPFLQNKSDAPEAMDNSQGKRVVMIVMDASGSMADPAPGFPSKMLMAKQVLENVLAKIDPSVKVGLRVYGSRKPSGYTAMQEACRDSVMLVPAGTGNRGQIINQLRDLKPAGATPIGYAMREAVSDLRSLNADKKTVVLISDGIDTCGYDPCALATSMEQAGVNVQFNVVGLGIGGDARAREELDCIASSTHGKFYTADTAAQLAESILDGMNFYSTAVSGVIREAEPE